MKSKKKVNIKRINIIIFIIVIIIALLIAGTIIYQKNKDKNTNQEEQQETEQDNLSLIDMKNTENAKIENGVKENTSENIAKDRKLGNLSITDIKLVAQDGVTAFTATVKNNSTNDFEGGIVKIIFTNKDGSNYAELEASIPEIVAGGTNAINAGTTADIANAYDFTIELEK